MTPAPDPDPHLARHGTVATPFGPFTVLLDADGAVLASGWTPAVTDLLPLVHPDLRPARYEEAGDLGEVGAAVHAFHAGDARPAAGIAVNQRGGAFLEVVWTHMRTIEPGAPLPYSELAERAGRPAAVRAAAAGCARNAAALFVPCHRVLRRGGGLGGFRWGTPLKADLIALEARARAARAGTAGPGPDVDAGAPAPA